MNRKRLIKYRELRRKRSNIDSKSNKFLESISKFEKTWLLIPFIFYAVGYFIHNTYLSNYAAFDFELIQTKYIYIGVLFSFYLLCFIGFLVFNINLEKIEEPKLISIILFFSPWSLRFLISIILIYHIITFTEVMKTVGDILSSGNLFLIILIVHFYITTIAYLVLSWSGVSKSTDSLYEKSLRIYFSLSIFPVGYVIYLYGKITQISLFDFLTIFGLFFFIIVIIAGNLYEIKLIKESKFLSKISNGFIWTLILFFIMILYSKNIYQFIPSNFGGAKPVYAIIYTEMDTIRCRIINENSEWLLIDKQGVPIYERIRVNVIRSILISEQPLYESAKPKSINAKSDLKKINK